MNTSVIETNTIYS